jgi:hypothetical protein
VVVQEEHPRELSGGGEVGGRAAALGDGDEGAEAEGRVELLGWAASGISWILARRPSMGFGRVHSKRDGIGTYTPSVRRIAPPTPLLTSRRSWTTSTEQNKYRGQPESRSQPNQS